ncbi:hypothetical protein F0562_033634 [Nyssa sinensis]|uniref:Uncharacterized protein n=1 Tax=Nyssa sinensis TaxID=561372 RepID=A0A5J5AJA8_9ASTE|nr:hypothetical protein F0562_033634 [Nyssa sinensis]
MRRFPVGTNSLLLARKPPMAFSSSTSAINPPVFLSSSKPLSLSFISLVSSHRRFLSINAHSSPIPFASTADCDTFSPLGGGDNNGIGKKGSEVLLKGMRYSELEKWVQSHGYRPGQALMLWKRLYGNNIWAHCIDELEGLNKDFKKMLSEHANFKALSLKDIHTASDGTRKEVADFIHIGRWTSNRNSCYTLSKG